MKNILLVDDETGVLNALRRVLRDPSYHIDAYDCPAEALAAASGRMKYDVIVSDYQMPGMNGVDFLVSVQKTQPHAVRMILSGRADQEAVLASINSAGVFRFLNKPWDDEDIKSQIRDAASKADEGAYARRAVHSAKMSENKDYRKQQMLEDLEASEPGITKVERSETDTIILDPDSIK